VEKITTKTFISSTCFNLSKQTNFIVVTDSIYIWLQKWLMITPLFYLMVSLGDGNIFHILISMEVCQDWCIQPDPQPKHIITIRQKLIYVNFILFTSPLF